MGPHEVVVVDRRTMMAMCTEESLVLAGRFDGIPISRSSQYLINVKTGFLIIISRMVLVCVACLSPSFSPAVVLQTLFSFTRFSHQA